jgi:hypothetical protein
LLVDTLEVEVTDILVFIHKLIKYFLHVGFEVLGELRDVHRGLSLEVDLLDDLSILNIDDLHLDVLGVLENNILNLLECADAGVAHSDVLVDGETEPVVVLDSLVHLHIEHGDLRLEELSLDWLHVAHSSVVCSQKLIQLVNVPHVVLLLKGDVDDSLRDLFSNSV